LGASARRAFSDGCRARSRSSLVSPLILSCNPANNELKPGQRQPLPKSRGRQAAGAHARPRLTPNHGQILSAAASTVGLTLPERLGGVASCGSRGGPRGRRLPNRLHGPLRRIGLPRGVQAGRMPFLTPVRSSKRTRRTKAESGEPGRGRRRLRQLRLSPSPLARGAQSTTERLGPRLPYELEAQRKRAA
jgi:hypothetical protein